MRCRPLGKTGVEVSEVGLGAWQLGADWGAPMSGQEARAILEASLDAGVNFIDTADVYGSGRSEERIGALLASTSTPLFVATKQGRFEGWEPRYEVMKAHAIASCKRLGVEALDLVQLHCIPTETLRQGEVFEHLQKLKDEGLIRFAGASVQSVEEAHICLKYPVVSSLQVIFNIFRQKLLDGLFDATQEAGVGILARVPLASGVLAGKFTADHAFHAEDHRHYNADGQIFNVGETFAGVPFAQAVALASKVADILEPTAAANLAQLSLRWILDHPAVSTVIPGASRVSQAQQNAAVSALEPLSKAQHDALERLYRDEIQAQIRGPY